MKVILYVFFLLCHFISTVRDTISRNVKNSSNIEIRQFVQIKQKEYSKQNVNKISESTFPPTTKLLYFRGDSMEDYNHITWGAISERHHCCWILMCCIDSIHWKSLDTIQSTHYTNVSQDYYYDDYYTDSRLFYKLVSIDNFGINNQSQWITLYRPKKDLTLEMFPNPTAGVIFIRYKYKINAIEIYNINGELKKSFNPTKVDNQYQIDISDLEQGLYILRINIGGEWRIWKVLKV